MGLLYGAPTNSPSPNMDWLQAPGCCYVNNRVITNHVTWLTAARAAGCETLYYTNVMEVPREDIPGGFAIEDESQNLYDATIWSSIPDSWFWTGSKATAGQRMNYAGNYMLDIRPGSAWLMHVLDWAEDFWTRHDGRFDGFFLDVLGNRLWVSVWNTMRATADARDPGSGRTEAMNWVRGVHWFLSQLRARVGPEVILIPNNTMDEVVDYGGGVTRIGLIPGAYPSMQKGGHPAVNGCMFEGAQGLASSGQHSVARVNATIAGTPIAGASPNGWTWATLAGGRKRFMVLSSRATAQTDLQAYTGVPYTWIGAAPSGYTSKAQTQVSGTTRTAWDDHIQGWTYTGGGGGDTTPPQAPSAFGAGPAVGMTVPLTWTLPTDTDRAQFTVAYKGSAWTTGQGPTAGATALTRTPGVAGSGSATVDLPDGTWWLKAFTADASGNVNTTGPSATVTVSTAADDEPDGYGDHDFQGSAATKPDQAVWTDPDMRMIGVASSSLARLDGSGVLEVPVLAATQDTYGSVIIQRRVRFTWTSEAPGRALLVEMGGDGPAGGATSFYLVGPSGADIGNGLTNVFDYPTWLRFEHIGDSFRVVRKINGASVELYNDDAPAGDLYEVWVYLTPGRLIVEVDGVEVVDAEPWAPEGVAPFSEAFLYFDMANDDAAQAWTARVGRVRFMRNTPSTPATPTATVGVGSTVYDVADAPPDEVIDLYHYLIDGVEVAAGPAATVAGPELAAGTYTLGVQTENASPFTED
jgi:hypothetical protein